MHYSEFLEKLKVRVTGLIDDMQHQYESQMKADPKLFPAEQTEEAFEELFNSMYEQSQKNPLYLNWRRGFYLFLLGFAYITSYSKASLELILTAAQDKTLADYLTSALDLGTQSSEYSYRPAQQIQVQH